jgi:hypothetical protein
MQILLGNIMTCANAESLLRKEHAPMGRLS